MKKIFILLFIGVFLAGFTMMVSCSDKDELVEEVETPDDNETPDEPENTDDSENTDESETTDESDGPEDDESGDEEESDEPNNDDSDDDEEEDEDEQGQTVVPELENGEIAIVGYRGVPPSSVSTDKRGTNTIEENYQIMKECGFNTNLAFVSSEADVKEELDAGVATGMDVILRFGKFATDSKNYVPNYDSYESLAAYWVRDVDDTNWSTSKGYIDNIKAAGGTKPCYLYCSPGSTSSTWYQNHNVTSLGEFYEKYVVPTGTSYLSFMCFEVVNSSDGYGEISGGDTWFEYLDASHSTSLSTGLPFWGFICSVAHWDIYPAPNLAQARLQVNLNLAYGAQGLLFYTYWLTVGDDGDTEYTTQNHHDAPIGWDGKPTDTYYVLQQVISETKEFNKYFYKGTITDVCQVTSAYNKATVNAPEGAVGASLTTQAGNECLVFVNKSLSKDMTVTYGDDVYTLEPGAMTVFYK